MPRDLLKIGLLLRAGGAWNGKQVVPGDWVKCAITPAVTLGDGRRYGYHWYLGASPAGPAGPWQRWMGGIGWGGQRLYIFPELDLVVAQTCGNYYKSGVEQRRINDALIAEVVLPSFV
jgi:CubicO group peptidase (beta-lactamase class C family)